MKYLRRPTKMDILLNLFDEVGKTYSVKSICEITGISNPNSLKSIFSYIRKSRYVPDENRVDIRVRDDQCTRVN